MNIDLFKRLNLKLLKLNPYNPRARVVERYFNRQNSKNEPQRTETDILSE